MDAIFHDSDLPMPQARKRAANIQSKYPAFFGTEQQAVFWLRNVVTPADGRWAFKPNGKTGTTSTLYFLYHLLTGHPLSARFATPDQLNDDQAGHQLVGAGIFRPLLVRRQTQNLLAYLEEALCFTTVRHPLNRALSGFAYICAADAAGKEQFFAERVRMTALTGFDWTRDPNTSQGFLRFLEYLPQALAHHHNRPVDSHFRPQVLNILPEVFRPDLIGKCEDLPSFMTELAARLDMPVPEGALMAPARNQNTVDRDHLISPAARQLVTDIFAADFEAFAY